MKITHLSYSNRNVDVNRWIYVAITLAVLLSLLVVQPVALAQTGGPQLNPLTADVTVLVNEGDALILQGQFEQAEAKYMEAVRAKPNDPLPYNRWSRLLLLDMKLVDAAARAQVAVTIAPTNAEANLRLARALDWQGRHEEAFAAAQQAITLDPANAEAHAILAEINLHLGRSAEAQAEVATALQLAPTHPEAYRSQALMLAAQGDYQNAIQAALKAAQQQSAVWLRLHDLAEMLRGIGDCAQAITFYQSAINLRPEAISYAGVALCYIAQGQLSEATTALQSALQLDPVHPQTLGAAGLLYATAGQCEQAGPYIRLALQLNPNQAVASQAAALCPSLGIAAAVSPLVAPTQSSLFVVPTTTPGSVVPASTPEQPAVALATTCQNGASYVADVTIPDYTQVEPGQRIDKIWRVQNSGTCTWGPGYQLGYAGGDQMNAPASQAVASTPPGGTADVQVSMYAPAAPGTYTGYWQMRDAAGQPFGSRLTVIVVVMGAVAPPPPADVVSPPDTSGASGCSATIDFRADDAIIEAGDRTTIRWDVECVREVYFQGAPVTGHESREVRPAGTTAYTLRVVKNDGGSEERQVTVSVTSGDIGIVESGAAQIDVSISLQSYDAASGAAIFKIRNARNSPALESVDTQIINASSGESYSSGYSNAPFAPSVSPVPFESRLAPDQEAYLKHVLRTAAGGLPPAGVRLRARFTVYTGEGRTGDSAAKTVDWIPEGGGASGGTINADISYHSYDASSRWVTFRVVNTGGVTLESAWAQMTAPGLGNLYGPGTSNSPFRDNPTSDTLVNSVAPGATKYMRYHLNEAPPGTAVSAAIKLYSGEGNAGQSLTRTVGFTLPAGSTSGGGGGQINANISYHSYDRSSRWVTFRVVNTGGVTLESAWAQMRAPGGLGNLYGPATSNSPFRDNPTSDTLVNSVAPGATKYMRYKLKQAPPGTAVSAAIKLYSGEGSSGQSMERTVGFILP